MKKVSCCTLLVIAMLLLSLAGCSTTAMLYPVEGPLSQKHPPIVLEARADGITGNTGNISLTLPDGENCKGKWSVIAPLSVGISTVSANSTFTSGIASAWGTVYGSGYTIRNVPGVNRGEAILVGDKGTTIQLEFYTGSGTANGIGAARDNRGNIYKVLF